MSEDDRVLVTVEVRINRDDFVSAQSFGARVKGALDATAIESDGVVVSEWKHWSAVVKDAAGCELRGETEEETLQRINRGKWLVEKMPEVQP